MISKASRLALLLLAITLGQASQAGQMLMARSTQPFEVAMAVLQEAIADYGYTVAHVQKCDGGMTEFHYKTDFYRVVFFGKIDEVRWLTDKYPEIAPFLPLKIAVFAEKDETVFSALNPMDLDQYFADPEVKIQLQRWANDMRSMLNDVREYR